MSESRFVVELNIFKGSFFNCKLYDVLFRNDIIIINKKATYKIYNKNTSASNIKSILCLITQISNRTLVHIKF